MARRRGVVGLALLSGEAVPVEVTERCSWTATAEM
jgi:hypothetical protein